MPHCLDEGHARGRRPCPGPLAPPRLCRTGGPGDVRGVRLRRRHAPAASTARPAAAAAGEFSATRAFQHVRTIAARPHPAGSAANDAVRQYLVATLRGLHLTPSVQDTVSVQSGKLSASDGGIGVARVRNVVTRLPGTAPTGRIFVVAHYDSVQVGPGATMTPRASRRVGQAR